MVTGRPHFAAVLSRYTDQGEGSPDDDRPDAGRGGGMLAGSARAAPLGLWGGTHLERDRRAAGGRPRPGGGGHTGAEPDRRPRPGHRGGEPDLPARAVRRLLSPRARRLSLHVPAEDAAAG